MRGKLNALFQFGLVASSLILFSGAFTNHLIFGPTFTLSPDPTARLLNNLIKLPLYAIVILIFLRHVRTTTRMLGWQWPLTVLVGLAFISTLWSASPERSLVDATSFALLVLTGVTLACYVPFEAFSRSMTLALAIVCICSVAYVIFLPGLGVMSTDNPNSGLNGVPQGVFSHKNTLGEVSGIALLWGATTRQAGRWWRVALIISATSCLLLSDSATRLAAVLVALPVAFGWRVLLSIVRTRTTSVVILVCLGIPVTILGISFLSGSVLEALGRDSTLTGRTYLWRHALMYFESQPLFGYGASSIWDAAAGTVAGLPYFLAPHSHNSFLEVGLMFGLIGLGFAAIYILRCFRQFLSITSAHANHSLFFAFLLYAMTCSMFEHVLFRGNSLTFLILVTLFLYSKESALIGRSSLRTERSSEALEERAAA